VSESVGVIYQAIPPPRGFLIVFQLPVHVSLMLLLLLPLPAILGGHEP
jgi:hypothetical protein